MGLCHYFHGFLIFFTLLPGHRIIIFMISRNLIFFPLLFLTRNIGKRDEVDWLGPWFWSFGWVKKMMRLNLKTNQRKEGADQKEMGADMLRKYFKLKISNKNLFQVISRDSKSIFWRKKIPQLFYIFLKVSKFWDIAVIKFLKF